MKYKLREIVGLPENTKTHWCNLYEDDDGHIHDEDIAWFTLHNGVQIDAGQYGRNPLFNVVVVAPEDKESKNGWRQIENSICETTEDVAREIVRLANKYASGWYAAIAQTFVQTQRDNEYDDNKECFKRGHEWCESVTCERCSTTRFILIDKEERIRREYHDA